MEDGWRQKGQLQDFFVAKGLAKAIMQLLGLHTAQMHIEGNTIQIVPKEVAENLIRLSQRQGYGVCKGMKHN